MKGRQALLLALRLSSFVFSVQHEITEGRRVQRFAVNPNPSPSPSGRFLNRAQLDALYASSS